jgi:membrane protein required for colicin V production
MTWVDATAIGIVLLSALMALVRGFVREVLGVGAWVGAVAAAWIFHPLIAPTVARIVPIPKATLPISLGVVFLVVLIVLSIITAWIGGLVRDSALSGLDRTLGLAFGLLRGGIILVLLYVALSMFVEPAEWPVALQNARSLPMVRSGAVWAIDFLPPNYRPHIVTTPGSKAPPATLLMTQPITGGTNEPAGGQPAGDQPAPANQATGAAASGDGSTRSQ